MWSPHFGGSAEVGLGDGEVGQSGQGAPGERVKDCQRQARGLGMARSTLEKELQRLPAGEGAKGRNPTLIQRPHPPLRAEPPSNPGWLIGGARIFDRCGRVPAAA
jgi:hypothetical protein